MELDRPFSRDEFPNASDAVGVDELDQLLSVLEEMEGPAGSEFVDQMSLSGEDNSDTFGEIQLFFKPGNTN